MNYEISFFRWIVIFSFFLAVSACGETRQTLGVGLKPPDEFTVVTKAPLILPPDFGLRPPALGKSPPSQTMTLPEAVLLNIEGGALGESAVAPSVPMTRGEEAILTAARTEGVNPDIREIIQLELKQTIERGKSFAERVIFWQQPPGLDAALDAAQEAERLRAEGAVNLPPNIGQPNARRKRGRGIFAL